MILWSRLEVTRREGGLALVWRAQFQNERELVTDCVVDAQTGEVLAWGGG